MASTMIKLVSSDGQTFETDYESIKCMGTVQTMLTAMGAEDGNCSVPVPMPNIRSATLRKLLTYANYHKNDSNEPTINDKTNGGGTAEYISHWDAEFLNVTRAELFELINGANYLDMKNLMNVACQTVANMMKGRKPADIRVMFHIPNDIPPPTPESTKDHFPSRVAKHYNNEPKTQRETTTPQEQATEEGRGRRRRHRRNRNKSGQNEPHNIDYDN